MTVGSKNEGNDRGSTRDLHDEFGDIDVYVFDQLLKGRITRDMRILDAGCGGGRNAVYLLRAGADVFAVDRDPRAVASMHRLADELAPSLPETNIQTARLEALPFADAFFDAVICNAVLHFAEDEREFDASIRELWRVLKPRGVFFVRLASLIGIESLVRRDAGRRYELPDGSRRFLVDAEYLEAWTATLGGRLLDPIKTTVVDGRRAMTTWVLARGVGGGGDAC